MITLDVRNVHQALPCGLQLLKNIGVEGPSRNGPAIAAPCPVTTVYAHPNERVLFWKERDANPFFHLYEAMWMLLGRNDVDGPAEYAKQMRQYSDDDKTLHGAYGYRWRHHFDVDQLFLAADELKNNPESRRCVIQMWDARVDLGRKGKDLPCNTQLYLWRDKFHQDLCMTICCRSNDIVWGAYGTNAVHFSILLEFMASLVGCKSGIMYQMSNNYHAYLDKFKELQPLIGSGRDMSLNPYHAAKRKMYPLVPLITDVSPQRWLSELDMIMTERTFLGAKDPFLRHVLIPMLSAHKLYKTGVGERRYTNALTQLETVTAVDWQLAATDWILRRYNTWKSK